MLEKLIGDLPASHVTQLEHLFTYTGADYAGPTHVRTTYGRQHKSSKANITVFACLTIKAIHIEAPRSKTSLFYTYDITVYIERHVNRKGVYYV